MSRVEAMQLKVERHLDELTALFVPGVRVTFIARFPDDAEGKADVLITSDDVREIARLIERRMEGDPA